MSRLGGFFKGLLPASVRRKLVVYSRNPPVGRIAFGDLRRVRPVSDEWGFDRGLPVDRYYIERFLTTCLDDIRGHVLEIGTDKYTKQFGGQRVLRSDVLHVSPDNQHATIVADLRHADHLAAKQFDCIICTQTLQFIYEVEAAIANLFRILKPDGILLVTFPGVSQISRYDMDRWGDYWRFTSASAARLFGEAPEPASVDVTVYGNVLAATAFLHGIAVEDLSTAELDVVDPDYEVLVAVRAVKMEHTA